MSIKNRIIEVIASVQVGTPVRMVNEGKPTTQAVIRYKNYFIEILFDADTGEPCDFSWFEDATMTNVPVRDFYTAVQKNYAEN